MKKPKNSSFWLSDSPPYQQYRSSPTPPTSANVVVIGGGLSGVSVAYWLRKNGVEDVVILEQRGISNGATGRNGGHCWPTPLIPGEKWVAKYGNDEMNQIRKFDLANMDLIRQFLDSHPSFPDLVEFHTTGGIDVVPKSRKETNVNEKMMRYDYDMLMAAKMEEANMFWWDEEQCKREMGENTQFCCGIGQEKATQLWPAKLVFAILQQALEMGSVQVYTQTKVVRERAHEEDGYVVEYEMESQGGEGETERGELRCNKVVYAVNAWIPTLLPNYKNVVTPVKGQVLVTSPVSQPLVLGGQSLGLGFVLSDHGLNAVKKGMQEVQKEEEEKDDKHKEDERKEEKGIEGENAEEVDDQLFYVIRRKKDGRVVVGSRVRRKKGETEEMYNDREPHPEVTKEMEDFLETFPSLKRREDGTREWEVEYVWQGVMGFTEDDFPLVGPLGDQKDEERDKERQDEKKESGRYILGGFNGDGMPKCFGSGKVIAEMIVGKLLPEDFLASFSPCRFLK